MPRYLSVIGTSGATPRPVHGVLNATAGKRLIVNALPGVTSDGVMPEGFAAQMEQAFDNLVDLLGKSALGREDLVRVMTYVTVPGMEGLIQITATARLAGMRPPVVIRQVVALSQPVRLIEIDAEAVREN